MAPLSFVLIGALFAAAAVASPVVIDEPLLSATLVKRINRGSLKGLVERDQARAQHLIAKGRAMASGSKLDKKAVVSFPVVNEAVTYIANVAVGSPSTNFQLLIDTGSSNTWVGAGTAFKSTNTTKATGLEFAVTYGSGSVEGNEFIDQVSLASGLTIPAQSIGVATESSGFEGVDGILGIGPVDLTAGTLQNGALIPTVTDNLFANKVITSNLVAVSFNPTTSDEITNGELTFGGTDSTKFTGNITFTSITTTSPASEFWGINESITLGTTTILSTTAGIVDTGTTLVLIASNAFSKYRSATGGVLDNTTGLIRFTSAQFAKLPSLNFIIAGKTFSLTANAQLWPRALNTDIGGTAGTIYGIVNNLGSPSGEGLDFINGFAFLERFYAVFDTGNKRVGFATTPNTGATTN